MASDRPKIHNSASSQNPVAMNNCGAECEKWELTHGINEFRLQREAHCAFGRVIKQNGSELAVEGFGDHHLAVCRPGGDLKTVHQAGLRMTFA